VTPPSETDREVAISGLKTWVHGDNPKRAWPKSITVLVKVGEKVVVKKLVTAADGWAWKFKLNRYDAAGNEIHYTIAEKKVPQYRGKVKGYNITNTFVPQGKDKPDGTNTDDRDKTGGDGGTKQTDKSPRTGDEASILLWIGLMAASLAVLLVLLERRLRRRK
jgi:uncharacterized surface anchored protein